MTDDEMKTLPKKSYSTLVKHKKGEEPACRVCLYDFKKGESVCTLPCKHEYHHNCITEWLKVCIMTLIKVRSQDKFRVSRSIIITLTCKFRMGKVKGE